MKTKLIVILGQTASGKTALSIKLAKKFNGEIISADSRQVYKGMDIGSGKITPDTKNSPNFSTGQAKKKYIFTHQGIPHYCIDVASPKNKFSVAQYQKIALEATDKIQKKEKTPFLVGGTGFYIQVVVDGISIPKVKPDWKLRKNLEKQSAEELFEKLEKIDPRRAKNIDRHNKRRLIRALEIAEKIGTVPPLSLPCPRFDVLLLGIKKSQEELKKLISKRLIKRLKGGEMINEVRKLRKSGLSWKRLEEFGLEYRYIAQYLQKKIRYQEMIEKIQRESEKFAKRQITWFKKDKRIKWISKTEEARDLIKEFLK